MNGIITLPIGLGTSKEFEIVYNSSFWIEYHGTVIETPKVNDPCVYILYSYDFSIGKWDGKTFSVSPDAPSVHLYFENGNIMGATNEREGLNAKFYRISIK